MPGEPINIYQDQDKKYQWHTRGENCPYCDAMDGRIYTLDTYATSGVYPGFHKGCDCYAVEVPQDTELSDLDIFGSALNMRNNSWLNVLFGQWENIWLPGYFTNAQTILSNAKPGMTRRSFEIATKLTTSACSQTMFPGILLPLECKYECYKSTWRRTRIFLKTFM
jgi:hypothetical protein